MRYAETGCVLEIDLSLMNIEKIETDPKDTELFIGGLGTNAKILWEKVSSDADPFSAENVLVFGTGLLCGTPAIGANRTVLSSISPLTGLMAFSMMGGYWAPELKYAGYDKVVIRGKSPNWVYLWINDGKVEIRDASHLNGKGAIETQSSIKRELNEPRAQVAAIGEAGENRVFFSTVEHDRSSASRGGLGAVMGDKRLKAVAVRGTRDLSIAKPAEFLELRQQMWQYVKFRDKNPVPETPPINSRLGIPDEIKCHDEEWHANFIAWGNARVRFPNYWNEQVQCSWTQSVDKMLVRYVGCFNCPLECGGTFRPPEQSAYMMKCFNKMNWATAAFSDLEFNLRIAQRAAEFGVDSYSAPQVIAFAIELYQNTILTDEDCPGMPPDSEGRFYYFLDKIVRREGIGDVLANGVYRAARHIGKGAEAYDHNTIKKQEQAPIKLGMLNPIYFLMLATGEKVNITQIQGQFPQHPFSTREVREEFVRDWFQVPDEKFKQWYVDWESRGKNSNPYYPTPQMASEIVDWQEMMHYIDDATGVCAGLSAFNQKPAYHLYNYPQFISAGTGMDMDTDKLKKAAKRIRTLVRAINNRRGLSRADDKPPVDQWKHRFPEYEEQVLNTYYNFRGFNHHGIPTKETLTDLGLDYVAEDFVRRGILSDDPDEPSTQTSLGKDKSSDNGDFER